MKLRIIFVLVLGLSLLVSPAMAKKGNSGLPPGLQKNVERGKPLPPGWEKKLSKGDTMERDLYQRGEIVAPLDPLGIVTIRIEDKVFRVMEKSREIVDILRN